MSPKNALALSFFALAAASLFSEQPRPAILESKAIFTVLSINEGLANASVPGIVQDDDGFLWIATQGGLCRFDGSSFKNFENEPFDQNSISGDLIQTIYKDRNEALWIGTYNGLNRFDLKTEAFSRYRYSADDQLSLSNDLVIAIARDARGSIWAGTLNGLNRLDSATGSFERYFHDPQNPHSIPNNTIRALYCDSRGRLWIGTTGGGLARYDYVRDQFDNYPSAGATEKRPGPPQSSSIQAISEGMDGQLWLGCWGTGLVRFSPDDGSQRVYRLPDNRIYTVNTQDAQVIRVGTWGGGFFELDPGSETLKSFKHSSALGALPNDIVYSIFQDASGELWLGTNGGGLARLDRMQRSFSTYIANPDDPKSLPEGKIVAARIDSRGELWVASYNNGIARLDAATGTWKRYRHRDGDPASLGNDTCNDIYEDREGVLWICTNDGLSRFNRLKDDFTTFRHNAYDQDSLSSSIIYGAIEDGRGNMWVGTYLTGLDYREASTGKCSHFAYSAASPSSISDNLVTSLAYDSRGRLWVGTNNGLNRMEGGEFIRYRYDPEKKSGLSNSAILRIVCDSKGVLWIATRGGGLNRYYPETDSFTHFMRKDGLPGNIVNNILEDRAGNLWIVTQTGIAHYDRQTASIKRVSLYKALGDASFSMGACKGPADELYFGAINMLVKFSPERYETNMHEPPVFITDFRANSKPKIISPIATASRGQLALANSENSIEIHFAALDYREPESNQFAYRLDGFDKDWTYSASRNFATYTNLPGGRYVFKIKAANSDGVWNETGASIPFDIARPPFTSPFAIVAYLIILLFTGYGAATIRSNRVLAQKVKALTAAEAALKAEGEKIQRLAAEAEGANRAKSEFIATVSHEIRTPLNGVIGVAELLDRTRLDGDQKGYVETIRRSGETLLGLINEVLDFSKLEANRVVLETIPFDLRDLLERTRNSFAHAAIDKGLGFGVSVSSGVPSHFLGDPLRLGQVLANLVSNAIKFTDAGSVEIDVDEDPDANSADRQKRKIIRFRVRDTGIGIREGELDRLFKPFTQAEHSTTRRYGGTGLGLSISKSYIELMGGSLVVQSQFGKGSTFSFRVPLAPSGPASLNASSDPDTRAISARILVVDDDEVNRQVAIHLLQELGARARAVDSGRAAIAELRKERYDIVFMDCMMPDLDGFETTRLMRAQDSGLLDPGVSIIAMTARTQAEDREQCAAAGMNGYISKPLTLGALKKCVLGALEKEEAAPAWEGRPARGGFSPVSDEVFNSDDFERRYARARDLGREILGLYLGQSRAILEDALSGNEAGDLERVASCMHRLRGTSGAIGAPRLTDAAGKIEAASRGARGAAPSAEVPALLHSLDGELAGLEARLRAYLEAGFLD
jgi:signal transduction histidine kinase/ligand-binding sensor domain-containing protein/HPt (histidine-containing phosphotransfer) domain-containing protein/ActR/RegA family two-component response regulator